MLKILIFEKFLEILPCVQHFPSTAGWEIWALGYIGQHLATLNDLTVTVVGGLQDPGFALPVFGGRDSGFQNNMETEFGIYGIERKFGSG